MQTRKWFAIVLILALLASLSGSAGAQGPNSQATLAPLGTAITYQGRLAQAGHGVSGTCDFTFSLYDALVGGSQVGNIVNPSAVAVSEGLFTVPLDFGAGAFSDAARWLEIAVRCPAGSGPYTTLDPRQALTPAPSALYAAQAGAAPWSDLSGVPAGFADGVDNDTTYTAGSGLTLSGTEFSVNFAGSGAADTVARSDHGHDHGALSGVGDDDHPQYFNLSQNETVTGRPAFNAGDASHSPFSVDSNYRIANLNADLLDGQHASAFAGATHDHLGETWVGSSDPLSGRRNPLVITGTFSVRSNPATLVLGNANPDGDGLRVRLAGDAVHVISATVNGVAVDQASRDGVRVDSAGRDGVHVGSAANDGLYVGSALRDGVTVNSAGQDGVYVERAARFGARVISATVGVYVDQATVGLHVHRAEYGVSVERSGVGVSVGSDAGIGVLAGGQVGVWGQSVDSDGWGLFTLTNIYAKHVVEFGAQMQLVQNGGADPLEPGDVVVFSGLTVPAEKDGQRMIQVAKAAKAGSTAVAGVVYSRFDFAAVSTLRGASSPPGPNFDITPAGPVPPKEYLLIVIQGPARVKASALAGPIQPGDLLSSAGPAGVAGKATEVNVSGVKFALPGTIFGKALEPLDAGDGLIYAFVTLQ